MEYILIVLCLLGSAFFSGTEIAYTSLSKLKIKKERENPRGIQRLVLFIYDHFDNALSTLLIGNNIMHIGCSSLATLLATHLWGPASIGPTTIVITLVVFTIYTVTCFRGETLQWNHLAAFVCMILAVYFVFLK